MSHMEDVSCPDIDDMLKQAERLASVIKGSDPDGEHVPETGVSLWCGGDDDDDDSEIEAMLLRAESLAEKMKKNGEPNPSEEKKDNDDEPSVEGDSVDDDMLLRARSLAVQMRKPKEQVEGMMDDIMEIDETSTRSKMSTRSLVASVGNSTHSSKDPDTWIGLMTTVSYDDEEVDTMLLKADLLSRTIQSAANGQLNTPELLRASDEILKRATLKEEKKSGVSVDTFFYSVETDPVRNRPPRPPTTVRNPGGRQAITPSPKSLQSKAPDTEGVMEQVIATLQTVPTTKSRIPPYMPNSVSLKTADSDDYSSVGSGSARSLRSMYSGPSQSNGSPQRPDAVADDSSRKSVVEAEDLAKQMAQALEETLGRSASSSLSKGLLSPPLNPRKLMTASPSTVAGSNSSPMSNSSPFSFGRELAKVQIWEEHDAVGPGKSDYVSPRPVRIVHDVQWESIPEVKAEDDDYAPLQDFRKTRSLSLGSGTMPAEQAKKKRSWKLKRKKFIRAFVVCMVCLVITLLVAKMWYTKDPTTSGVEPPSVLSKNSTVSIKMMEEPRAEMPKVKERKIEKPRAEKPRAEKLKAEKPKAEKPRAEKPRAEAEKPKAEVEKPKAEKPRAEKPKAEKPRAENPIVVKPKAEKPIVEKPKAEKPIVEKPKTEKLIAEKPKTEKPIAEKPKTEKPIAEKPKAEKPIAEKPKAKNLEKPTEENVRTQSTRVADLPNKVESVVKEVTAAAPVKNGTVKSTPPTAETIEPIPARCHLPLGYLVSSKCRKLTKFDVHSMTDSMLR